MTNIYEQHDKAFANVSAYVILKDGNSVAKIAFKFPRDGAGRLYAYVHWVGAEMVRGQAGGYGYDKRSAAVQDAVQKMKPHRSNVDGAYNDPKQTAFMSAFAMDGGEYWDTKLRVAGFTVIQAV